MSSVDLLGLEKYNRDVSKLVIFVDKQFTPTDEFTIFCVRENVYLEIVQNLNLRDNLKNSYSEYDILTKFI